MGENIVMMNLSYLWVSEVFYLVQIRLFMPLCLFTLKSTLLARKSFFSSMTKDVESSSSLSTQNASRYFLYDD